MGMTEVEALACQTRAEMVEVRTMIDQKEGGAWQSQRVGRSRCSY